MQYSIVGTEDGSNITVFVRGQAPLVAHSSHPNYKKIVAAVLAEDESVVDLFDTAKVAAVKFNKLTERVSVANGRLFLDNVEVHDVLAEQVVRFLDEGVEDWKPLVAFFENIQSNPNDHSREQLYRWLKAKQFTITNDGLIVGYKGVRKNSAGEFISVHAGPAIVDGVQKNGHIPNAIGSVIEMPRDQVTHDPGTGCASGLHVSTFDFANRFGPYTLEVHVNPRDVVSVPTEAADAKLRTCRYTVVGVVESQYSGALLDEEGEDDECEDDLEIFVANVIDNVIDYYSVKVGDVFQDLDRRRGDWLRGKGRTVTVLSVSNREAHVKSSPSNVKVWISLDRLTDSTRFRKV